MVVEASSWHGGGGLELAWWWRPRAGMVVEASSWHGGGGLELAWWWRPRAGEAGARASIQPSKAPYIPEKAPRVLPVRRSLSALVGRKQFRGQGSSFPSETSRFAPLTLAHRGPTLPLLVDDRASLRLRRIWCVPTRYSATRLSATMLPASRVPPPPEVHQIGARKRRAPGNTILSQPYRRRVSADRLSREDSQLAASLEGEPGPTPAGKTLPRSYPKTRFRRERARDDVWSYFQEKTPGGIPSQ